jgi:hypothetical protein
MRLMDLFESNLKQLDLIMDQSMLESSVDLNLGGRAVKDLRVESLIKMAKQHKLRGLVVGRNIYWWPASNATHGEVAHKLGFDDYVDHRLELAKENNELRLRGAPLEIESWDHSVRSCPQLRRLAQSDQLSFYAGSAGWVSGPEFQLLTQQDSA